ncbi:MAG TPA: hypothetical protein VJI69_05790, partial [Bacteroidia bacterium]|nr:hypothetical protein [Bacteroidia bacterium]
MNKILFKYSLVVLFFMSSLVVYSQTVLDSMLIISVGSYKPTITDANKILDRPTINDSTKKLKVDGFSINNSRKVITGYDVNPIEAAEMVGEPLTKLYNGLVKVGFGNYKTPYAEA